MASKARQAASTAKVTGLKNLLHNSLFEVNQRNITSVSGTSGQQMFTADRWRTYGNGVSMDATIQTVTLPNGVTVKSHKTTATTSGTGSGIFLHPYQRIETFGLDALAGKTVSLSCWVRTNITNQKLRICDTAACSLISSEIPSDGQWHFVSGSHTLPSSATFLTTASDFMQFHPAFGGGSLASGDYIEFALPQFELGQVATSFEHRSYGEELALCQRYYEEVYPVDNIFSKYNAGSSYGNITYKHTKRSVPTISQSGTFKAYGSGQASSSVVTLTVNLATEIGVRLSIDSGSYSSYFVRQSDAGILKIDAEV